MDARAMLTQKIAALDDAAYRRRDDEAVASLAGDAALSGFEGLLLGAPRRVDLAREPGPSALLVTGLTASRTRRLPFADNAILVATDVDRGTVFAAPAFPVDPSKSPEPPTQPAPPPAEAAAALPPGVPPLPEAVAGGTAWLDVQKLLGLPRRDMRLALRVLYFDLHSNVAPVQIAAGDGLPAPTTAAAADALIAQLRAAGQSAHRLPAFKRTDQTPPIAAPGIVFGLAGSGVSTRPLHAALRLETTAAMLVQPAAAARPAGALPLPSAVVRAAVVVVVGGRNEPHVMPVEFPVWQPTPPKAGEAIDAAFSIDLAAVLPAAVLQSGAAMVYVFAGRHIAGPQPLRP